MILLLFHFRGSIIHLTQLWSSFLGYLADRKMLAHFVLHKTNPTIKVGFMHCIFHHYFFQIGVCDSDERMAFSLLCNYEPVAAECRIPRSGFVPGERIPISVSVQNNSRRNIDFVMLMLMQVRKRYLGCGNTAPFLRDETTLLFHVAMDMVPRVPANGRIWSDF